MKKRYTRILAMLLCVLSIAALLPTAALAADDVDEVKASAAAVAEGIKGKLQANGKTVETYKVEFKAGKRYKLLDPYHNEWSKYGLSVKYQWFVKKKSGGYKVISGATKYYYKLKATMSKNGYSYRLKITNKRNASDYVYLAWKVKVTK